MSQFQYCLSIDPDHHKCVSNLHWIVMQMYKLKTEVQNNHGINFRLVGIMQVCGQEKQIGRSSGFARAGTGFYGTREVQAKSSK